MFGTFSEAIKILDKVQEGYAMNPDANPAGIRALEAAKAAIAAALEDDMTEHAVQCAPRPYLGGWDEESKAEHEACRHDGYDYDPSESYADLANGV